MLLFDFHLLPSATELRRLCFYICLSVILFTRGKGCLLPGGACSWGVPVQGRGACSRGCLLRGGGGFLLLWRPPKETPTTADGMHPTGMHSCLKWDSVFVRYDFFNLFDKILRSNFLFVTDIRLQHLFMSSSLLLLHGPTPILLFFKYFRIPFIPRTFEVPSYPIYGEHW